MLLPLRTALTQRLSSCTCCSLNTRTGEMAPALASDTKNLFTVWKPLPQGLLSPSSLRVMLSSFGEFVNRFL